jgi:hypothetical protein
MELRRSWALAASGCRVGGIEDALAEGSLVPLREETSP